MLLTASGNLAKNFTGSFSAGANHLDRKTGHLNVFGSGFNIPNLYNIGNAKLVTSTDYSTHRVMNSAYFEGQVGYKNYLFLNVTGRNDWSSTLGLNNYSFFYPSVSSSFCIYGCTRAKVVPSSPMVKFVLLMQRQVMMQVLI